MQDFRLTEHFWISEFINSSTADKKGIDNSLPDSYFIRALLVARALENLRDELGSPIVITSGYRCPLLNEAVGGVKNSWHTKMLAVDIACDDDTFYSSILCATDAVDLFCPSLIIEKIHGNGYVHLAFDIDLLLVYFSGNV